MIYSVEYSSGKRNYTYQLETLEDIAEELKVLFAQNHAETSEFSDYELDPDWEYFFRMEHLGFFKLMTIRHEGRPVGYCSFFVQENIRYKGLMEAVQDMMFIEKAHRGIGFSFIKFCDELLMQLGIDVVWRQATSKVDVSKVYERFGYTQTHKNFFRRLK